MILSQFLTLHNLLPEFLFSKVIAIRALAIKFSAFEILCEALSQFLLMIKLNHNHLFEHKHGLDQHQKLRELTRQRLHHSDLLMMVENQN